MLKFVADDLQRDLTRDAQEGVDLTGAEAVVVAAAEDDRPSRAGTNAAFFVDDAQLAKLAVDETSTTSEAAVSRGLASGGPQKEALTKPGR